MRIWEFDRTQLRRILAYSLTGSLLASVLADFIIGFVSGLRHEQVPTLIDSGIFLYYNEIQYTIIYWAALGIAALSLTLIVFRSRRFAKRSAIMAIRQSCIESIHIAERAVGGRLSPSNLRRFRRRATRRALDIARYQALMAGLPRRDSRNEEWTRHGRVIEHFSRRPDNRADLVFLLQRSNSIIDELLNVRLLLSPVDQPFGDWEDRRPRLLGRSEYLAIFTSTISGLIVLFPDKVFDLLGLTS